MFSVVPFLHVSMGIVGKSATLRCRFPGWGLAGPFISIRAIGLTCKSRLVKRRCTVHACLQCRMKACSGVRVLYLGCNNHKGHSYL